VTVRAVKAALATITERQRFLRGALSELPDPRQRLAWILDRARESRTFLPEWRTSENLVPGCAARLWMVTRLEQERVRVAVDSESAILKAFALVLAELYDDQEPGAVLGEAPAFLVDTGVFDLLTDNRRRTVQRVLEAIQGFARAAVGTVKESVGWVTADPSVRAAGDEGTVSASLPGAKGEGAELPLADAHNHLHDERFGGRQADLVAACREAGIVRMVVNGSSPEDWPAVAAVARRFPDLVIPSFGLHPWYVHLRPGDWLDQLRWHLDAFPGAGVGEIGLDRWILDCPPAARAGVSPELADWKAATLEEQREVLAVQWELAVERGMPVSLHCLQAWGPLMDYLRGAGRLDRGFLLHSYGGPTELVLPLAKLGGWFGFPGYYLHDRKHRQREAFRHVPVDRLLVETDAPDQRLPEPWPFPDLPGPRHLVDGAGRGANHPANLRSVAFGLARELKMEAGVLFPRLLDNFRRLFCPAWRSEKDASSVGGS
jgi:TatD DNase family protein